MNKTLELLKSTVINFMIEQGTIEEEAIDKLINDISQLSMFKDITEDEKKLIRNKIHADFQIDLDPGTVITAKNHIKWFKNKKSNLNLDYWYRYKDYLIHNKKFPLKVVNTMDDISDELTDCLGDPTLLANFQRRGLVIGDVQSGKTANYTGLICKGADAGYKVIVLLTGTIDKLRQQTQARLDEGFIGKDSDAMLKQKENIFIGAGNYNPNLGACVFTSKANDFNTKMASSLGLSLNSLNHPVLFVIKKNVTVLKRLNAWLKTFNLNGKETINTSLLMIDDEADNASINTNSDDKDPTQTNKQIVDMLSMFNKSSYVGFTATPFANIFISPNSDEEMKKENLFPKDYIYSLDAPTNYIGARDIFGEKGSHKQMLNLIEDAETYFPQSHKKDSVIRNLSPSLRKAINQFLIINAIRDIRNDNNTHRSMIVNVSRFVNIQGQIGELINEYVKEIQTSVRIYSKLPVEQAIKEKNIEYLYSVFKKDFQNSNHSWDEVQNIIASSIEPIQTVIVNQKNYNTLNYEENEEYGLRVIAVGGLSLSRGLTLEGLCVSYFYRNSKMYDTLMQMGRWFGYRDRYYDLCKIWMDQTNIDWYEHISDATDELREEVKKMKALGNTPLEFGLKVKNGIDGLMVTALNKMRTATNFDRLISLSSTVLETPKIYNDDTKNEQNHTVINRLKEAIIKEGHNCEKSEIGTSVGFKNISKNLILEFLENYIVSMNNIQFDVVSLKKFINNYKGDELENWDVTFLTGDAKQKYAVTEKVVINCVKRTCTIKDNIIQVSGQRNRLGSLSDSVFGITKEQYNTLKSSFEKDKDTKMAMSQKYYFCEHIKRNPLLMIYMIQVEVKDKTSEESLENKNPTCAIAIGIPNLSNSETKYASYKINIIELSKLKEYETNSEFDEEEEYE